MPIPHFVWATCLAAAVGLGWDANRQRRRPAPAPSCLCGYDLSATPDGRVCPECGRVVSRRTLALRTPPAVVMAGVEASLIPLLLGIAGATLAWLPFGFRDYAELVAFAFPPCFVLTIAAAICVGRLSAGAILAWACSAGLAVALVFGVTLLLLASQPPDPLDYLYPWSLYLMASVVTAIIADVPLLTWLLVLAVNGPKRKPHRS